MTFLAENQHVLDSVAALLAAYFLALPLAWERKVEGSPHVGLRTLPLVSVGACVYLLLSRYLRESGVFDADGEGRTLRAMMTGIGFIGGGAILKRGDEGTHGVEGLTTATSVWTTGAIGACVAHGYYTIAAVLTLGTFVLVHGTPRMSLRGEPDPEE